MVYLQHRETLQVFSSTKTIKKVATLRMMLSTKSLLDKEKM